jgi:hypothetical protein
MVNKIDLRPFNNPASSLESIPEESLEAKDSKEEKKENSKRAFPGKMLQEGRIKEKEA